MHPEVARAVHSVKVDDTPKRDIRIVKQEVISLFIFERLSRYENYDKVMKNCSERRSRTRLSSLFDDRRTGGEF